MASDDIHSLAAAYALDALDPEDETRFTTHLADCERCQGDVAAFMESSSALGWAVAPVEPPPLLRDRILTQARAERPNVIPLRPRHFAGVTRVAAAVAAVAACAAVGLGIWAASLKSSLNEERSAAPRLIELSGASGTLVVTPSGKAALAVSNLREAPAGKTYEVWVIEGKTPKRAGLMEGGNASAVKLERPVRKGAVVAVTLERDGGVDAPTSTPLFSAKV